MLAAISGLASLDSTKKGQLGLLFIRTFASKYVVGALRAGASGYVLKNIPTDDLVEAIRLAHRGLVQLDVTATQRVVEQLNQEATDNRVNIQAQQQIEGLTERERDVLRLVANGASNREIAEQLFISEGTVKTHISRILTQLDLRDRTQLAIFVHSNGLF